MSLQHSDSSTVTFRVADTDAGVSTSVHNDGPPLPGHERRVLETGRETSLEHGGGSACGW